MVKKPNRRKFFIKKNFEGKVILGCLLLVAGGGLLFDVLLGLLSANNLMISNINNDLQLGQTPVKWFLLVTGSSFVIVASFLLSHRIAGPLYRFETTLENMQKGQLDNIIRLRDKDEGKELAQKINDFNKQLSQSFALISQNSRALQILTEQALTLELAEKEKEQLASLCWAIQEHNRKISNSCNYFCPRNE